MLAAVLDLSLETPNERSGLNVTIRARHKIMNYTFCSSKIRGISVRQVMANLSGSDIFG